MAIGDAGKLGSAITKHKGDLDAALQDYQEERMVQTAKEVCATSPSCNCYIFLVVLFRQLSRSQDLDCPCLRLVSALQLLHAFLTFSFLVVSASCLYVSCCTALPTSPTSEESMPTLACLHWHAYTGMPTLACLHWHAYTGTPTLACLYWHTYIMGR